MTVEAGKDKIILVDVKVFEAQSGGWDTKNTDTHDFGVIHSVPLTHREFYSEGETVILRGKAVSEPLTVGDVKYYFVQPLDILCKIKEHD